MQVNNAASCSCKIKKHDRFFGQSCFLHIPRRDYIGCKKEKREEKYETKTLFDTTVGADLFVMDATL